MSAEVSTAAPWFGARIVALGSALAATLALALPWAAQEYLRELPDGITRVAGGDGTRWSGWALHGTGQVNSHRPLPLLVVVLLVLGTVALFVLTWLVWEADPAKWPVVCGLVVAAALSIAAFPLLNALQDDSIEGRAVTAQFGFVVWRVAVLLTFLGLARAGVLQEQRGRAQV